ncbi:AAA family ATPase [Staphylococcus simulans]|uniref:AAA family ATPase n=1 Tax=Staphylococcus simulans TaxID=1286 RepID=UPI0021D0F283|nr:AAA family ATPase [Staphylococcus simulans]UXR50037.1 AAA family ATPase [Staphylococcus simulans]
MISEVKLPSDRFIDEKITGFKRKNFFYGKNGTGKSSITQEIINQYSESQTVLVFQGFKSVIAENGKLNAISLGNKNSELQPLIDKQNEVIKKISEDINDTNEMNDNTIARLKKANEECESLEKKIDNFCKKTASKIKNEHPEWTGIKYNKNDFKTDINIANPLSESEISLCRSNVVQTIINNIEKAHIKDINVEDILESVNQIITTNITKSAVLNFHSKDEMNWAKEGLHLHKEGEVCAFCGSTVNKSRLDDLNSYFNDEMKKLEMRIDDKISQIKLKKIELEKIEKINERNFYPDFHVEVDKLNLKIMDMKNEYHKYLEFMLQSLNERKENIFLTLKELSTDIPKGFKEIIIEYNKIFEENSMFNNELEEIKKEARKKLKLNEVSKELDKSEYHNMKQELEKVKEQEIEIQNYFDEQHNKLLIEKNTLKELISQTVDESKAADNINKLLTRLGNQSFKLINVKDDEQKGQYNIKGYNDEFRDIETLSTGEKNIVAFLWFISKLEETDIQIKDNTIIIFDDPMNSNDDTVQYLIITELQRLLKNIRERQIFIFTHNIHFYINARYQWWRGSTKPNYDKTTYHLVKQSIKTKVNCIDRPDDDLKTSYDALWSEVGWLYDHNKPDMMLNPLRRIFETFQKFNGIKNIFSDNLEAQKLFNVNSHSIDDLEADLNGKSEQQLMEIVREIFEGAGAEDHYNNYWKK